MIAGIVLVADVTAVRNGHIRRKQQPNEGVFHFRVAAFGKQGKPYLLDINLWRVVPKQIKGVAQRRQDQVFLRGGAAKDACFHW